MSPRRAMVRWQVQEKIGGYWLTVEKLDTFDTYKQAETWMKDKAAKNKANGIKPVNYRAIKVSAR